MASHKATTESDTSDQKTKKSIRDRLIRYILIRYRLVRYILLIRCRLTRYKLIRYSIAFSPIFSGGLLLIFVLIFGDASDLYPQMVMVIGLSVLVTVSLFFYNKQEDDQKEKIKGPFDFEIKTRLVDQALIVSLWFFGAIGVLCSGLPLNLEIYFQTITALAVMYVLLVAFRIERLVRRTEDEEEFRLDLMEEALQWHTIYRRDIEAVIVPWRQANKEAKKKVEEIVIEEIVLGKSNFTRRELAIMGRELASMDHTKENFREIIMGQENKDDESKRKKLATDFLALRLIIEIMEKIDTDESGKGLANSYRRSMADINWIGRWETEKANWIEEWETGKANKTEKAKGKTSDTDERIVKLNKFQSHFTRLINSRQQGNNLTELIAIGLIGFALVALMNLGFPGIPEETGGIERITGFGAFSVHLFTLFTSTIVVFLFFNILDLGSDRRRPLHKVVPDYFGSDYRGPDYLGPDSSSELWKGPIYRGYWPPSGNWISAVSVFTTIVYVVLLLWINW